MDNRSRTTARLYVFGEGSWRTVEPEPGWQPISTAPRGADEWIQGIQKNAAGFWMVPYSMRSWRDGYWTSEGGMDPQRLYWQPTHWRRLPGPPITGAAK